MSSYIADCLQYSKKQETDNNSDSLKNIPQAVGNDRDEHGCLASAGYTWSEVQKDCIRLFEKGIRVNAADGSERSAFIVFSPDSTLAELFFSDKQPKEILERRTLPTGKYAWNIEDDDTKMCVSLMVYGLSAKEINLSILRVKMN